MNKDKAVTTETETAARQTRRKARKAPALPPAPATLDELEERRRELEKEFYSATLDAALKFYQLDALPREMAEASLKQLVFDNWLKGFFHGRPFPVLMLG